MKTTFAFLATLALTLTCASATFAAGLCQVEAKGHPDLEVGINRETICRETARALNVRSMLSATDDLKIRVLNQETYSLSLEVEIVGVNPNHMTRLARLDWSPGDVSVEIITR